MARITADPALARELQRLRDEVAKLRSENEALKKRVTALENAG